jgi:hypothetical protein
MEADKTRRWPTSTQPELVFKDKKENNFFFENLKYVAHLFSGFLPGYIKCDSFSEMCGITCYIELIV